MCWSKESSLAGFILNSYLIIHHYEKKSEKLIPVFITVALTQLFDFFVYSGYNKYLIGKLLGIVLALQVFFIYKALLLPKIYYVIPLILLLLYSNWDPYKNYYNDEVITWNENKYSQKYL